MGERAHDLLGSPRLSVISREPDRDLARTARTIAPSVQVGDLGELAALLAALVIELDERTASPPGAAITARTLDLFGHATADGGLLRLGRDVIDAGDPAVLARFAALGQGGTLGRLGITAIRLLACSTAVSARGRATICRLAEHTGVEVFGTRDLLYDAHYDAHGFAERWRFLLVSASELRRPARGTPAPAMGLAAQPHRLSLAALPAVALADHPARGPRRIATASAVDRIIALVRGDAGGALPGPVAPCCELALAAAQPGTYHVARVVQGGAFIQVYPDGDAGLAVAYPVTDPAALRRMLDELTDPEPAGARSHDRGALTRPIRPHARTSMGRLAASAARSSRRSRKRARSA